MMMGIVDLKKIEQNYHRRHSNLGHRAMGQVVFLPRPENNNIKIIILNKINVCPEVGRVDSSTEWRPW